MLRSWKKDCRFAATTFISSARVIAVRPVSMIGTVIAPSAKNNKNHQNIKKTIRKHDHFKIFLSKMSEKIRILPTVSNKIVTLRSHKNFNLKYLNK